MSRSIVLTALVFLGIGCSQNTSYLRSEASPTQRNFIESMDKMLERAAVREAEGVLSLTSLAAMSTNHVLIGGCVRSDSGSVCAVAIESVDGGESWREVVRAHPGCVVKDILSWDENMAWIFVAFSGEGTCLPMALYHTQDGGVHWSRFDLDPGEWTSSGKVTIDIQFLSPKFGYAVVRDLSRKRAILCTHDSGETWERLAAGFTTDFDAGKFSLRQVEESSTECVFAGPDGDDIRAEFPLTFEYDEIKQALSGERR